MKRYSPKHLVPAKEIREFWGAITHDFKATKGVFTTTSDFAPGILKDFEDRIPQRIELVNGDRLKTWLKRIQSKG